MSALFDDLMKLIPAALRPITQVIYRHGTSGAWGALREIISNAVDATVASGVDDAPPIRIDMAGEWIDVTDGGTGVRGDLARLLLRPALSTKSPGESIGRMGIGFLASLSAMTGVVVVTRSAPSARTVSLCLGDVPPEMAAPRLPYPRGTLVRARFREGHADPRALRDFLLNEFPFVSVGFVIEGLALEPRPPPWTASAISLQHLPHGRAR